MKLRQCGFGAVIQRLSGNVTLHLPIIRSYTLCGSGLYSPSQEKGPAFLTESLQGHLSCPSELHSSELTQCGTACLTDSGSHDACTLMLMDVRTCLHSKDTQMSPACRLHSVPPNCHQNHRHLETALERQIPGCLLKSQVNTEAAEGRAQEWNGTGVPCLKPWVQFPGKQLSFIQLTSKGNSHCFTCGIFRFRFLFSFACLFFKYVMLHRFPVILVQGSC